MSEIFMTYGTMITPLGNSTEANFDAMLKNKSGVKFIDNSGFNQENWPLGRISSLPSEERYNTLLKRACHNLIEVHGRDLFSNKQTLVIISSTKADINALPKDTFASTRTILKEELELKNKIVVISNACISGVIAINTAADYLNHSDYEKVVVIGIDALSDFIVYGFQSLFALSNEPSKPFDKNRKGICIGEACGVVILSKEKINDAFHVNYLGGSSSNDANHISGPSRTGEGLFRSVNKTMNRATITSDQIDFISAHGTGTNYNDEMESIAFDRLGLINTPLNSLKGYFGHTLGAAGLIEVISTMKMMEHNILLKSIGFEETGTTRAINVLKESKEQEVTTILKTASGFGGGNASLLLKKCP
ncbi:MAG TPA: beta-ketoacyl synthase [Crocinitomicaceae bacterium]|nr:beta-ketoacyl synthase [Crocinitomicaceae bacterium]